MTVAASEPVTTAVVAAMVAGMAPVLVGDGKVPAGGGWQGTPAASTTFKPYVVVYGGSTPGLDGTLADPHEDGIHAVQATYVARTRATAEALRDQGRAILLDRDLAIAGHVVADTSLEVGRPVDREDTHGEALPLFVAVDIVHLDVTPA